MFRITAIIALIFLYYKYCDAKVANATKEVILKEQVRVFIETLNSTFEQLDILSKEEGNTIINIISDDSKADVLRGKEMMKILQDNYITKLDYGKPHQNNDCMHQVKTSMLNNLLEYDQRMDVCSDENVEIVRNEIGEALKYTNLSIDKGIILGGKLTACNNKPSFSQLMCYRSILVEMPSLKTSFQESIDVYKARFRKATMTLKSVNDCIAKEIGEFKFKAQALLREGLSC